MKNFFGLKKGDSLKKQADLDKKLVYSLSKSRIPSVAQFKYLKKFLSKRELWAMRSSFLVLFLSLAFLGYQFYHKHFQVVPLTGGEYIEGMVGSPKNINPLYASLNSVDRSLAALIYSSLFRYDSHGELVPDLAKSMELSSDGRTYVLKIRNDAYWHDGQKVGVDDIIFTLDLIQNEQFRSTLYPVLKDVAWERADDETIKLGLKEPYAPFPHSLTFGIMPEHIWGNVTAEGVTLTDYNIKPIGSGPFKFHSLIRDKNGLIRSYVIEDNGGYYGAKPRLDQITFRLFPSAEEAARAMNEKTIDGWGNVSGDARSAVTAKASLHQSQILTSEIKAVFFNGRNNKNLGDQKLRQALALAVDRQEIISQATGGNARAVTGPILPDNFAYSAPANAYNFDSGQASHLLEEGGWKIEEISGAEIERIKGEKDKGNVVPEGDEIKLALGEGRWLKKDAFLVIKLTVLDNGEDRKIGDLIKQRWEDIGVKTVLDFVSTSEMPDILSKKSYEALIYREIVGADPDVYAFWHSSQAESGANLSLFNNKEADLSLEQGRMTSDVNQRKENYRRFQEIINQEAPAIFLYSSYFIYPQIKEVKGVAVEKIFNSAGRFANVLDWYLNEGHIFNW